MMAGRLEHVEVRLGDQLNPIMLFGFKGTGDVHVHNVPVVETMTIVLYSPTDAFTVKACSEPEQLVKKNVLINTAFDDPAQSFGRWLWNVTPLRAGNHSLALRISARVNDSLGFPASHSLVPDRVITVDVTVNGRRWAGKVLLWLAGGLTAAFIGAAVQDQLWPLIRDGLLRH